MHMLVAIVESDLDALAVRQSVLAQHIFLPVIGAVRRNEHGVNLHAGLIVQDFVLHNQTGVEINSVFVSPHSADDWQEDVLGQDTLANGQSVKITFNDRDKHVHWDLKVTDKNGNALEWYDLNLVEIEEVTLHWDAAKKKGWADIK